MGEYKDEVARVFPAMPRRLVEHWSIQKTDVVALSRFFNRYPSEAIFVFEIGTFVGVSTFHLATQPKVSEVVSVDYNPSMAELQEWMFELGDTDAAAALGATSSLETTVLDVARTALARFSEQQQKVKLVAGKTGTVDIPISGDNASFVAFVDGDHRKESVYADLRAIFKKNPHAVALLHDCTDGYHGPSVRAGVETFIEAFCAEYRLGYRFRLFERLAPCWAPANLGVLYPDARADQIERALSDLLRD